MVETPTRPAGGNLWWTDAAPGLLHSPGNYENITISTFKLLSTHKKIVAAFRGMRVSPAKHSFGKCDRQTDRQTDRRADRQRTKWSLCVAMLCRWHKNAILKATIKNQGVFVKHYAPGGNKVQKAIFSFKVKVRSQGYWAWWHLKVQH